MRKPFDNWLTVCRFTFSERVRRKKFIVITVLVAVILLAAVLIPLLILSKPDDDTKKTENEYLSEVTNIALENDTSYDISLENVQAAMAEDDVLNGMIIDETTGGKEFVGQLVSEGQTYLGMILTEKDDSFDLTVIMPYETTISEDTASTVGNALAACLQNEMIAESGADPTVLILSQLDVTGDTVVVGEDTSLVASLLKMLLPMVFGLFMYMMLLFYGQDLSQEISSEKTSKLMETMLTSIHPYALVLGKVVAVFCVALVQSLIWIGCLIAALFGGSVLADKLYGKNSSTVTTAIGYVREHIGGSAFSVSGILLSIIIFLLGILLFFCFAAIAGSMVSKPEDTATVQPIFVWPILICWMVPYMASMTENTKLLTVCEYIPFTAPFCLPIDLIIGSAGIVPGITACVLILLAAGLLIMLSARIYRGLVLYIGEKLSWKVVWGVIRGK